MAHPVNPCTECGACCANFKVDFARAELLSLGGAVPDACRHRPVAIVLSGVNELSGS